MKNQNDFIWAGAFLFVAIIVGLIFLLKTRKPDLPPAVPTIVTEDAQIQEASVVYGNSLPGGGGDSSGGAGSSVGLAAGGGSLDPSGGFAAPSGNVGGSSGERVGRPSMGVSR
ncbi:MAG: hypothetical protein IH944_06235 [Armatimonadetes bacterium]|nr:hypothetical protein [Armatimonadota bacterium]